MAIDGITIKALTKEFKEKLIGGHIQKIYQINDHVIILNIYNKKNYKLLISSNPQNARIHLTEGNYTNPTKPPQFANVLRKHIQNSLIKDIKQLSLDRSLELTLESKDDLGIFVEKRLLVDIMGKYSNIVLTNDKYIVIEAIKRISHEMSSIRAVYPGTKFTKLENSKIDILKEDINLNDLDIPNKLSIKKIFYTFFTGFGPVIGDEIAYKANLDSKRNYGSLSEDEKNRLNLIFHEICLIIKNKAFDPTIYLDNDKIIDFYPLVLEHMTKDTKNIESISLALDKYYLENVNDNSLNQSKENLKKQVQHILNKSIKKIDNLRNDFELSKHYDKFRIEGDLLSTVAYSIKKGQTEINVHNFYDDEYINISLDPRKSSWENIELKYKNSKKLHKSYKLLSKAIPELDDDINYINSILNQIDLVESKEELNDIKEELRQENFIKRQNKKTNKNKEIVKSKPHKFITENENIIYVGKNNKQNEELTLRLANQDDLFFHIKDLPGSHVILKKTREFKDFEIQIAAYLAAKFSKNGNDRYIDVDYTFKKNVNKSKGSKPGMVYYTDYTTLRVDLEREPEGYKKLV